nr:putative ribonuclease H-like domain-containing protein [Tanacetum cinerariifolium]
SEINSDVGQAGKEKVPDQEYILLPLLNTCSNVPSSYEEVESSPKDDAGKKSTAQPTYVEGGKTDDLGSLDQQIKNAFDDYSKMTNLEDTSIFDDAYDNRDEGAEADYNNLETVMSVSPTPSTKIEPNKVTQALDDEIWVEAMQEELLQLKLLNVWTLVKLPHGKRAIETK